LHFGIREHGMGAVLTAMALHGGLRVFGATFLVFSDYMRGAVRVAALSKVPVTYVWTHDSIWVGEDGPTHQPIEHVMSLRLIPNLVVVRPGDANETREAWRFAQLHRSGPVALILTRQNLPTVDRSVFASAEGLHRGAYVLAEADGGTPDTTPFLHARRCRPRASRFALSRCRRGKSSKSRTRHIASPSCLRPLRDACRSKLA
jgi:transketolase